jgi:hypothetical protein
MSRLATAVISAQSIGTGTDHGEGKYPIQLSLQSSTTAFAVEAEVTNGAAGYMKQEIIVRYAVSSNNYSAADAVLALRHSSRYIPLFMRQNGGEKASRVSLLEPANGAYLYVWVENPKLAVAALLTVKVLEHYTA